MSKKSIFKRNIYKYYSQKLGCKSCKEFHCESCVNETIKCSNYKCNNEYCKSIINVYSYTMDIQIKIIKIACVYANILKIIIVDSVTNFVKNTIVIFVDPIITKNVNFITQLYVIIIIIILINVTIVMHFVVLLVHIMEV